MTRPGTPLIERLRSKVVEDPATGCWNRRGRRGCDRWGYWKIQVRPGVIDRAHRVAYALANGPVPNGMMVCHRCDNPCCANPAHLFLGTALDNVRDMASKGRARRVGLPGELNPQAKLTDSQVAEVRALFAAGGTKRGIARRFGVSPWLIHKIALQGHRDGKPRLVKASA